MTWWQPWTWFKQDEKEPEVAQAITEGMARSLGLVLELKSQHMERFFARRLIEWRVSLALWASFAVIANAGRDIKFSSGELGWILRGVIAVAVLHLIWELRYAARGAIPNRDQGIRLENVVRRHLGLPTVSSKNYSTLIAHVWPAGITALLGAAAYLLFRTGS